MTIVELTVGCDPIDAQPMTIWRDLPQYLPEMVPRHVGPYSYHAIPAPSVTP